MKRQLLPVALAAVVLSNILIAAQPVWALPMDLTAGSALTCRTVFRAIVGQDPRLKVKELLSASSAVYRTTLGDETFVTRLPTRNVDVQFEVFANLVMNSSPDLRAPQLRVLSVDETQFFLRKLSRQQPGSYREFFKSEKIKAGAVGTITEFSRGRMGAEYLNELGFDELPLRILKECDQISKMDAKFQADYETFYLGLWRALPAKTQSQLIETLGPLFGATDGEVLVTHMLKKGPKLSEQEKDQTVGLLLAQLPQTVRTQVADAWALNTVLGIYDFHDSNWLVENDRVIPIDLTLTVGNRLGDYHRTNLELFNQQTPLGDAPVSYLIKDVSPKMIEFLNGLSADQLQNWAKQSHYLLYPEIRDGMRDRARLIVRYHQLGGYPALWPFELLGYVR